MAEGEREWLSDTEVAARIGMGVKTFDRLVKAGKFPEGYPMSDGITMWPQEWLTWWRINIEVLTRHREEKSPRTNADKSGQTRTNEDK